MDPNLSEEYDGRFDDEVSVDDGALGNGYGDNEDDIPEAEPAAEPETEEESAKGEAEGEQEPNAEEPEDEPPVAKKEPMLPKSRYDSVRKRLREAEARLAEVEKAGKEDPEAKAQPDVNFDQKLADLNKQFAQAALDGDADAMASINQQLMVTQREQFQTMLAEGQTGVISTARDSMLTDSLVDELVTNHEVLNPESETFDRELVGRINDMRDYYESRGFKESEALVKTIEVLMPQAFAPSQPATKPAKGEQSLRKKVEAANRQPPSMKGIGEDASTLGRGTVPDINKMSLADLDQLTDSDWDKMLGNSL
jgi:hypothetical protein